MKRVPARFHLAYFVLAVALGAAAGLLVVAVGKGGDSGAGQPWSDWRPRSDGLEASQEIAGYVGRRYRLPSGKQLVGVLARPPQVQENVPLSFVAISSGLPDARQEDIKVFRTKDSVVYILCGVSGAQCAIGEGKASTERAMLLRREALELALYTFKYVDGKDAVLAFLPPPRGQAPSTALFFRRRDFTDRLHEPLGDTLMPRLTLTPGTLPSGEEAVVRTLTLPDPVDKRFSGIYHYRFDQTADGTAVAVLSPLA